MLSHTGQVRVLGMLFYAILRCENEIFSSFIDFLNGGIVFPLGKGGVLSNKWTTISAAGRPLAKLIACEASPETKDNIMEKIIAYKLLQVASFLFVKTFVKPT